MMFLISEGALLVSDSNPFLNVPTHQFRIRRR